MLLDSGSSPKADHIERLVDVVRQCLVSIVSLAGLVDLNSLVLAVNNAKGRQPAPASPGWPRQILWKKILHSK